MVPAETDNADFDPGEQPVAGSVRIMYLAEPALLATVRADFEAWLTSSGVVDEQRQLAVLVMAELSSNAVEASGGLPYEVIYRRLDDQEIELTVANESPIASLPPRDQWRAFEPLARRGRGLGIVESLARSVEIDVASGTVRVTVRLLAPMT